MSVDGQQLAVGGDRQVRFWDLKSGTELPALHGLDHWVIGLAYSPDGRSFATATSDPLYSAPQLEDNSMGAMFLNMMLRSTLKQGAPVEVRIWDAPAVQEGRLLAKGKDFGALAFRRDGLLAIGRDGAIDLWDLAGRRKITELIGHAGAVTCLAFTPEGDRLISGGADGTTRIWDVGQIANLSNLRQVGNLPHDPGREVRRGPKHAWALTAIVVLPDGLRAASAAGDETVVTWEIATGRELLRAFGPASGATHLVPLDAKTLLRCSTGMGSMNMNGGNGTIRQIPGAAP